RLVRRAVPAVSLVRGFGELSKSESQATVDSLRVLLRSIQKANDLKTFAPCHTCRFNQKHEGSFFCGLTKEPLTDQDVVLLCREHKYPMSMVAR
ncbi:MAG: MarR family transcriptional regulator, partial [Pseudomonadota bacterium]